jgi:hypothetical protein
MATTTTNYGWAIPTSTDLVKDGATAIATLGSAIDTSVNTALGTKKAGMVLLNTTSFSGVSSISLAANTFTANYLNYRITLQLDSTATSSELNVRMRASGTDNTSANYVWGRYGVNSANGFAGAGSGGSLSTTWNSVPVSGTYPAFQILDIFSPFSTDYNTGFNAQGMYMDSVASNWNTSGVSGVLSVNTSYDSMTFYGPTVTGVYSVYGYNK